ncbi:hypothetical protein FLCU109888_12965 [Flavobacterium cucumis]|uniref:Uncharacterized protein n=1 Tax=Flavobacterium cucumis TaxID=416016 RepID=A0A1M7ZZB8_9FLAO|nr:hypothetical protein [Flavobacterium cucumis]SHO73967.1 hypothetical protein SAMN05443547_2346 [Flavobacterium cucumis]
MLGLIDLLLGRELGKVTNRKGPVDKGTNGGAPTQIDKVNDGVDAVGAGAGATNEAAGAVESGNKEEKKQTANDSIRTTYYGDSGKIIREEKRAKKDEE